LLVDSESIGATLLTRADDSWASTDFDRLGDVFELAEIGCRLSLSEVYEGLSFAA
jgi:hypothetical protein